MRLFIHGVALTLIAALFLAPPSNAPAAPQNIPALRPRPQDAAHGVAGEAFPALADDIVAPPALIETTAATSDYLVVPIYFVPHDRVPDQRLVDLINNRMRWVQAWYGWQIGDRTFTLADAVTVMHHGRIILEGTPEQVRRDPEVREIYFGHA